MMFVELYRSQPNEAKEIKDNLSDDNPYNDQLVCDSIESQDENSPNSREILNRMMRKFGTSGLA